MSLDAYKRNLRYLLRSLAGVSPRLYRRVARKREKEGRRLWRDDCDLVIEGFPRSGNSFAVRAFRSVQDREVVVAHHFHASSQVVMAARHGCPVLVVIRRPEEAVASLLVRDPALWTVTALVEYLLFHRIVLRYKDKIVVADFNQVTGDFGAVIARVNDKYGTAFRVYEQSDERDRAILEESFRENRRLNRNKAHVDEMASVPVKAKVDKKRKVYTTYQRFPNRVLLRWAKACYQRMKA